MKLKTLAVAASLLCGVNAFAGIDTFNDAEVFGVVWDETVGTYAVDFGITWSELLATTANGTLATVAGTNFASFTAAIAAASGANPPTTSGTQWAIFAADTDGFFFDDGSQNVVTTSKGNVLPLANGGFQTVLQQIGENFAQDLNQNGLTPNVALDGDVYIKVGSVGHFVESFYYGTSTDLRAGNAVGSQFADVFACTTANLDGACTKSAVQVSFDGTSFNVTTAVPEPSTYALMFAGLAAVGFVARRRRG